MAFDIDDFGGYGSGSLGNVTDPPYSVINAYAAIENTGSTAYKLNLIPISNSQYQSWDDCVGCQVLIHAVTSKTGNISSLGKFFVATITEAEYDDETGFLVIRIDKNMYAVDSSTNSSYWQALLIPEFNNLTLQTKSLKPEPFTINNTPLGGMASFIAPCGGVVAFKCKNNLTLAGGHVDLRDFGLPTNVNTTYRPALTHENNGTLDTDIFSGAENSITKDRLALNAGDGACLIMAKHIVTTSGSSRIGNPDTYGVQYCRGASDSTGTPAGVSNLGGSTIAIACDDWNNFTPAQIAKYRSGEGRGLARAYIAVRNAYNYFLPDEGLYSLDTIKNTSRLKDMCNFLGFGNGSDGNYSITSAKASKCWNSYAAVTAISGRVYTISRVSADVEEVTDFTVGRLVLIHQSRKASAQDYHDGRFWFSRITAVSGNTVTIKHNLTFNLSTYNVQIVVVPEYNSLTVNQVYNNTPQYWRGAGGIFAIAVKGNCNLSGATIDMEAKGTFNSVVNPMIGNYYMKYALPLGQGHGSILIIAKNLTLDSSTRLGATYDGSQFGGDAVKDTSDGRTPQGGWKGQDGTGTGAGTGGSGSAAGTCSADHDLDGGWHSNSASSDSDYSWGCQGAHIMIIADSITGFNLAALSTGGAGGRNLSGAVTGSIINGKGGDGGAGYGGGGYPTAIGSGTTNYRFGGAGGYRGGGATSSRATDASYSGGGGAGAAFVYVNTINSQDTSGLLLS